MLRILGLMVRLMPIPMAFVHRVTVVAAVRRGHAAPVVAKGHALACRYGGKALQRHGKRDGEDEEKAQEAHGHDCI